MKKEQHITKWHKLDNTANIFPVISGRKISSVYRVSASIIEDIEQDKLQKALEQILPYFSAFKVRLKAGLFWYYFETNPRTPRVEPEQDYPCRYIDPYQNNMFLFRVSYYKNRINLEAFHALTDANGAFKFLKALCYTYLKLCYEEIFTQQELCELYGIEHSENVEDSYAKYYENVEKVPFDTAKAFHICGTRFPISAVNVTGGNIELSAIKEICAARKVSVGEYITAVLIYSIYTEYIKGNADKRTINIYLPVDLRRFFSSNTSLNFFSSVSINMPLSKPQLTFDEIIGEVSRQFAQKLTRENLLTKLSYTVSKSNSKLVRIMPLVLKNAAMKIIYKRSSKASTMTLSNVGVIDVLPQFSKYFTGFDFLLSPTDKDCIKCTATCFGRNVKVSFVSVLENMSVQKNFFRFLSAEGIDIEIESNGVSHENM